MSGKITYPIALICMILLHTSAHAATLFEDSFESGDRSHTENGLRWLAASGEVEVRSSIAHTGNYSLAFTFTGNASGDAFAEQRFDLARNMTDVYIRYYIRFPANYAHRDVSPNNNKAIRIWSDNALYSGDSVKLGASFRAAGSGLSILFPEGYKEWYNNSWALDYEGANGNISFYPGLGTWELTRDRLEEWICFEWHVRPDTGSGNGALEFWADGIRQFGSTTLSYRNAPPPRPYYRTGYLLGWSNSGFDEDTTIHIDDVAIADSYIGPMEGGGDTTPPSTPTGLVIEE